MWTGGALFCQAARREHAVAKRGGSRLPAKENWGPHYRDNALLFDPPPTVPA